MGYFLDKAFKESTHPPRTLSLIVIYEDINRFYNGKCFIKTFNFKCDEVGQAKCKKKLFKFLTLAYMDLDCDVDGKYENYDGKRVIYKKTKEQFEREYAIKQLTKANKILLLSSELNVISRFK